jgi:hypothetical protein
MYAHSPICTQAVLERVGIKSVEEDPAGDRAVEMFPAACPVSLIWRNQVAVKPSAWFQAHRDLNLRCTSERGAQIVIPVLSVLFQSHPIARRFQLNADTAGKRACPAAQLAQHEAASMRDNGRRTDRKTL